MRMDVAKTSTSPMPCQLTSSAQSAVERMCTPMACMSARNGS